MVFFKLDKFAMSIIVEIDTTKVSLVKLKQGITFIRNRVQLQSPVNDYF